MLRSELDTEIGNLLGDPNHDRWSLAIIHERENTAQTVVQALTNAIKSIESITTVADTNTYPIDSSTLDVLRVRIQDSGGNWKLLEGITREDLDFYNPDWQNANADEPRNWFYDATNFSVKLWPTPSSSWIGTDYMQVWEVRIPTEMTADSDVPFNSNVSMQAYAYSIVHWVVAQCWMDDGTPEALAKSKFHKSGFLENPGEFEKYIKMINAKFDTPSSIPARIMWAPQGGRLGLNRPSKAYPFAG